jgi:hypothetical protein
MSDILVWTFAGSPFYPIDSSRIRPEGVRDGRLEVFNLVGTGLAEFNTFGFGEYNLQMDVRVFSDSHATTLKGKHLTMGQLIGDGTNVTAILADVVLRKARENYYEGSMTFKWSGTA